MKKILMVCLAAGVAGAVILAAALFYLGPIVKSAVERAGPEITKASVKLDAAAISIFNGSGQLKGFILGNPRGFKTADAVKVGTVSMTLVPRSVFADKVVVRNIRIDAPEITYEAALGGSNIGKLLENIQAAASREKSGKTNASSSKALQVDEFVITGGKINVSATILGGKSATLALPEIRLTGLGQGPEGITPAALSAKAFGAIVDATAKAVAANAANIGKAAAEAVQGIDAHAKDRLEKFGSGISDLLKSKSK